MSAEPSPSVRNPEPARRFRQTLVRVMAVQVVALILLWVLQQRYSL